MIKQQKAFHEHILMNMERNFQVMAQLVLILHKKFTILKTIFINILYQ